jgi:hypothetical protein
VTVVHSSESIRSYYRIKWKEDWKDYPAIIFDYSSVRGPTCVVPVDVLFNSNFVKEMHACINRRIPVRHTSQPTYSLNDLFLTIHIIDEGVSLILQLLRELITHQPVQMIPYRATRKPKVPLQVSRIRRPLHKPLHGKQDTILRPPFPHLSPLKPRQSGHMIGLGHGTPKFSRNLRLYRRSHRRFHQPKNLGGRG